MKRFDLGIGEDFFSCRL